LKIDPSVTRAAQIQPPEASEPQAKVVFEGQPVTARVLAAEDGSVRLKTPDGAVFSARFEGAEPPRPGDRLSLVVSAVRDGVIYMRPADSGTLSGAAVRGFGEYFTDRADAAAARLIAGMGFPVSEETVAAARAIASEFPEATPQTAAFLAANGIEPTAQSVESAKTLLSGDRTAVMQNLLEAVETVAAASVTAEENTPRGEPAAREAGIAARESAPETAPGRAEVVADASRSADAAPRDPAQISAPRVTDVLRSVMSVLANASDSAAAPVQSRTADLARPAELANARVAAEITQLGDAGTHTDVPRRLEAVRDALASRIAALPEFANVPQRRITALASALVSVAEDADASDDSANGAVRLAEKLFPELRGRAGETLKARREETPARLAVLAETLEKSGGTAAAQQSARAESYVKLQNDVNQYLYAQIPLSLRGERKTAELYVFKRRPEQKKIDAENVNILLAIDLASLGHWESFIGISGKNVSFQMRTETEDARGFLADQTAELHKSLSEIGYKLESLRVACGGGFEPVSPQNALSRLEDFIGERERALDIVV
jgi:hypothetical protein